MMDEQRIDPSGRRPAYMILSPHSLNYASLALRTLFTSCMDDLHLHLITDSADDRRQLEKAVVAIDPHPRHTWQVFSEHDLADRERERFADLDNLRAFRHGHPCWRKITDPLLLAEPGSEMILLDPDLYFPNRFRFEQTPATGLLLMWQKPNCLLPADVVRKAMTKGFPLARHVDIGVAHWRFEPESQTLGWVDMLIGRLGGKALPRAMHVEAIVWSAIAMHCGGGYLDPERWVCWHRSHGKRIRRKLGVTGVDILAPEPWEGLKCFHAGGEAKWWLPGIVRRNHASRDLSNVAPAAPAPFVELSSTRFDCEQTVKNLAARVGYQRLFGAHA